MRSSTGLTAWWLCGLRQVNPFTRGQLAYSIIKAHCFHVTLSIHPTFLLIPCIHKYVLYVCISIAALKIGSSVFSFWLTLLCVIGSKFIHLIRTNSNAFLLWLSNIPLYILQLLQPFICWWTSRSLPSPGYCKQCCNEHGGMGWEGGSRGRGHMYT